MFDFNHDGPTCLIACDHGGNCGLIAGHDGDCAIDGLGGRIICIHPPTN